MSDISYVFQQLKDRPLNVVEVIIYTESDCDPFTIEGSDDMKLSFFLNAMEIR